MFVYYGGKDEEEFPFRRFKHKQEMHKLVLDYVFTADIDNCVSDILYKRIFVASSFIVYYYCTLLCSTTLYFN